MQLFCHDIVAFGLAFLICTGQIQGKKASKKENSNAHSKVDVEMSDAIAKKVLSFALQLKNQVKKPQTVIFSPVSVMSALATIMMDNRDMRLANLTELFGQTDVVKMHQQFGLMLIDAVQPTMESTSSQRQLDPWRKLSKNKEVLKSSMYGNGSQKVRLSNGLFLQLGNKLKMLKRHEITVNYRPDILHVDFGRRPLESMNTINSWVDLHTNAHVDEMLKYSFKPDTERVFVTILSFKANWEMEFSVGLTKDTNFYRAGFRRKRPKKAKSIPMMTVTGDLPYYLSVDLGCHIIGIPYEGDMTTMYLIKPIHSSLELLEAFHQMLSADDIEEMIKHMRRRRTTLVLPKMSFDVSLSLRPTLEEMGLSSIFDPIQSYANQKAAIRGSKSTKIIDDLTITEIFQKVYLRVDEKGTEISDGTVGVEVRAPRDATFLVNEPFIMLVRNDLTKLPLYYGVIFEPPVGSQPTN